MEAEENVTEEKKIFPIFTIMKIYNKNNLPALQIDVQRKPQDEENANSSVVDWERTRFNKYFKKSNDWLKTFDDICEEYDVDVPEERRVLVQGVIYSASPEFWIGKSTEDARIYLKDCYNWHIKNMCQEHKDKIIAAYAHLDQNTPHMHVYSVPIWEGDNGRNWFSSSRIIGIHDGDLCRLQDRFYNDVAKKYGLSRGIPSDDKHKYDEKSTKRLVDKEAVILTDIAERIGRTH